MGSSRYRLRPFLPEALDDGILMRLAPLLKERLVRLGDATELLAFLTETDAAGNGPLRRRRARAEEGRTPPPPPMRSAAHGPCSRRWIPPTSAPT